MGRWLVTQGDHQFAAQDLNELKHLASAGRVSPGDMVQPPGASDWMYASELPELAGMFSKESTLVDDDDLDYKPKKFPLMGPILIILIAFGAFGMYYFGSRLPSPEDLELVGGTSGMKLSEMLVTGDAAVRGEPSEGGPQVGTIAKDSTVQLLAKRGMWYSIRTETGVQGWVSVDDVVPAYFFRDAKVREDYDPLYNPDRYVFVKNSSWMQLPDQREENITIFQFLLKNESKFEMTAIKLLATIRDKNDRILETKEIEIDGNIPPYDGVFIGTLGPSEDDKDGASRRMTTDLFESLQKEDPKLALQWSDGVEVAMGSEGFIEANIDLLEVRAIPKEL